MNPATGRGFRSVLDVRFILRRHFGASDELPLTTKNGRRTWLQKFSYCPFPGQDQAGHYEVLGGKYRSLCTYIYTNVTVARLVVVCYFHRRYEITGEYKQWKQSHLL